MFDAHIQYYCYNNTKEDEFGVGYIGNKEFWVGIINRWNKNDHLRSTRKTIEDWDDLSCDTDFRGCQLAEVVPNNEGFGEYSIYWQDNNDEENSMIIDKDGTISWENNPQNKSSVPRWVKRLKKQLDEANS